MIYLLDFVEIETPLLFRKTSEGAKEFEVPFTDKDAIKYMYTLPQSPQQVCKINMTFLVRVAISFNP